MAEFRRNETFCPRVAHARGILEHEGWRLKRYDLSFDGNPPDDDRYREGVALALSELPRPSVGQDRPGVGILIRHSGRSAHYVIAAWWDNQNELLSRVFVRDVVSQTPWHDAGGRFSVCVWDLEVHWHERCAYVRWVLTPRDGEGGPDVEGYLRDVFRPSSMGDPGSS